MRLFAIAILGFSMLSPSFGKTGESRKNAILNQQLLVAVKKGFLPPVKRILAKGAFVNHQEKNGKTALMIAAWWGYNDIVQELLSAGANANLVDKNQKSALIHAASFGRLATVKILKKAGANIQARDNAQRSALWWAANLGHGAVGNFLANQGADINAADLIGQTPLIVATINRDKNMVKLLLSHSASSALKDKKGRTALMWATGLGFTEKIVPMLKENS